MRQTGVRSRSAITGHHVIKSSEAYCAETLSQWVMRRYDVACFRSCLKLRVISEQSLCLQQIQVIIGRNLIWVWSTRLQNCPLDRCHEFSRPDRLDMPASSIVEIEGQPCSLPVPKQGSVCSVRKIRGKSLEMAINIRRRSSAAPIGKYDDSPVVYWSDRAAWRWYSLWGVSRLC